LDHPVSATDRLFVEQFKKKAQYIRFVLVAIIILALAYILKHRREHHVPLYVAVALSYE